ncbi:MAG TPA: YdeI/OmpD-associated family protein [Gemmatimonadales bacterium]|nr:YdeI/OmpD-associated family protein [Gemmatimonadales bacterium]
MDRSGIYAYEQRKAARLPPLMTTQFKASPEAWAFFQRQPAGYRQTATWWVVTAKKEETRARRLGRLIADSAAGRTIKRLTRPTRDRPPR